MMPPPMMDLGAILDDLPVAVWVGKVPDGGVVYTNRAFERILGSPVAASRLGDASQTYAVFDRDGQPYPSERLPFSRVLATGQPVMVDDMVARRAEGSINMRCFGAPVHDAAGTVTHVIVAFLDITREVAVQVERNRVEAHLRFACDHAPIAIWTTDADSVVTMSEGAASPLSASSRASSSGRRCWTSSALIPPSRATSGVVWRENPSGTPPRRARRSTTPG